MKVVLLAAGYATRLRPLTDDRPKHLLPVGGRPMLEWVLDRVRELDEVDGVHLVTNSRFAPRSSASSGRAGMTWSKRPPEPSGMRRRPSRLTTS